MKRKVCIIRLTIICLFYSFTLVKGQTGSVDQNLYSSAKGQNPGTRSLTYKVIGTAGNILTLQQSGSKSLTYNPELNLLSFIHRRGGIWGGLSSEVCVKYSTDFFTTRDSLIYTPIALNLFRYPNNGIFNPAGNTDPLQAFSVISGPCVSSSGSNWTNNYLGSQKFSDVNTRNVFYEPIPSDSVWIASSCFALNNDRVHTAATVYPNVTGGTNNNRVQYYHINNGIFNSLTNKFDYTTTYIKNLFKVRSTSTWAAHNNIVFEGNGTHGFFYVIGKDSIENSQNTAMPIVWETVDGGQNWTKEIFQNFEDDAAIRHFIWPTSASHSLVDSNLWVFRANIPIDTYSTEENSPSVIDGNGHLHIAAVVEGLCSSHPDSLSVRYSNQPKFLFDLERVSANNWKAVFIDTIKTKNTPTQYGDGITIMGWAHWVKMSKSPDGSKIFAIWTDSYNIIDSSNYKPEIKVWARDINTQLMTSPILFSTGNGIFSYIKTPEIIAKIGSTYKIPITFVNAVESYTVNSTPQKINYLNGVELYETDFNLPLPTYYLSNLPYANFNTPLTNIDPGTTINFTDYSIHGPTSWSWIFPGGTPSTSSAQNPSGITYNTIGNYDVQLIVSNSEGTDTLIKSNYIHVNCSLTAEAGNSQNIVCGKTTALNVTTNYTNPNLLSFNWNSSSNLSATDIANPTTNPITTTTYYITISATNGCTAIDSVNIIVTPLTANAGTNSSIVCGGSKSLSTSTNYTGTGTLSYTWTPSTGLNNANIQNPIVTITSDQTYYLTVTTDNGCIATDDILIQVNPLTANAGNNKTIICGATVQLDNVITNYTGTGNLTYSWSPVTGLNNPVIPNPTSNIIATQTYIITVTTDNGCTATDNVIVQVNPLTANAGNNKTTTCSYPIQLDNVTSNYTGTDNLSYSWSNSSSLNNFQISNPVATISSNTQFDVTITTTNGCTATDGVFVSLIPMNNPEICLVSVDNNYKNIIIWDKPLSANIDSFLIYKETNITDVYEIIGGTNYADISTFVDTNSNPIVQSNKYKLAMKDNCGLETSLSLSHKTMHLSINQGTGNNWNLIWEEYFGFSVSTYNIFRGTTPLNLTLIGSVSGSNTQYTDVTAPTGDVYYQVEVVSPNPCNPSKIVNSSRSNIATNASSVFADASANNNIICNGSPVQLNAYAVGGNGTFAFSWTSIPTGFISSEMNPIVYPDVTTTYNLSVTSDGITSTSSVTVEVYQASDLTLNEAICPGQNFTVGTSVYTATGVYVDTLQSIHGCDSVVTLNLILKNSTSSVLYETACDSYILNGSVYTSSNVYTQIISNTEGCDSVITLNLTINNGTTSTLNVTACDLFTLNGISYTSSNTYTQTIPNTAGCDSIISFYLTINNSVSAGTDSTTNVCSNLIPVVNLVNYLSGAQPGGVWVDDDVTGALFGSNFVLGLVTAGNYYHFTYAVNGNSPCLNDSATFSLFVDICEGISGNSQNIIHLYPNPVDDYLILETPPGSEAEIINMHGQIIKKLILSKSKNTINLKELINGVYFIRIKTDKEQIVKKMIKQ